MQLHKHYRYPIDYHKVEDVIGAVGVKILILLLSY